jgi:hypothetical protein
MIAHKAGDFVDLDSRESTAALQPHRIQPEFCDIIITLDVYVRRLISIASVKEESIGTKTQNRWHQRFFAPRMIASSDSTDCLVCAVKAAISSSVSRP